MVHRVLLLYLLLLLLLPFLFADVLAEEGFKKEYQVMSAIRDHPNLVQFIGVCIDRTQMSLVWSWWRLHGLQF
jgi:hypothetical protein